MKDKPLKYIILGSIAGIAIIYLIITLLNQLFERQVISQIKDKGELVVLIRNAPTIYYEGPQKPKGFEYELMAAFAEHLGVDLRLKVYAGIGELLAAIENKEGDLATGAITRTEEREDTYVFGPDYYTVQQVAVYRGGMKRPENIEDLANFEIQIIAESSYDERLRQLKEEYPDLEWETTDELSTEQLLYQVWRGELECTIADQNIVAINRRYYPGIEVAFPIGEEQSLAWVLNEDLSELGSVLEDWLDDFDEAGSLARLRDKYYGYVEIYDFVDLREFHKRIRWRLPVYRKWFQEAAEKYNIPWTLLAAQAYQESHWNKRAKSP
nr:transporter substrate-binding domain-containing protein [Candidatus Saccharibacteria bacterium]NIV04247.1 transporter substrate-binding domain-containing protein [Calditrichia bacterium]NIV99860.1 transporter substrate-binding domain-containing protein [Candidatus Saccharibacteria bacterium]NIW78915.1 transporter substrate-binding domain-containing protein [Calditrichia bacterium]